MLAKNTDSLQPNPLDKKQTTLNQHSYWQPLPKTLLIRGSYQMLHSIGWIDWQQKEISLFYLHIFIWFPELDEGWKKKQAVLEQLISSCCHTDHKRWEKAFKPILWNSLSFHIDWGKLSNDWRTFLFTCSVNLHILAVLCAGCDKITRCRLSPTPMRFTEGCALCPIIQHCAEDRPLNPQCHCSQTTVEIEVSKCMAQRH